MKRVSIVISGILGFVLLFGLVFSSNNEVYGANIEYKDTDGKTVKLSDFRDTEGHWAHDQILKWADYSIVVGSNGNFMPNSKIIRGDLAIMVDRMLGLKNTTYNYFNDLNTSDYYRESVLKCVAEGYINGIGNNSVNPRGYATREEVASILCRVFSIDTSYSGSTGFRDDSSISSWAKPSIYALSKLGYMNGSGGYVNPKSHITRAEMITLLSNIADTYISKKDIDGVGTTFVSNFPKNVVTARNIELKNAIVGRDLYITQSASTLTLVNSTVRGKVVAMSKATISLNKANIEQIYLLSEKSNITGVDSGVEEVYVSEFASESSLDAIPNKLILEAGVRVKVSNIMYENTSSSTKTYYGIDLKADIADEQGYVVGGPKVSGVKANLDYSNTLTLTGVKITNGNNNIREIGVIWLNATENEDPKNPTYKNNDGKVKYTGAYTEPFTFNVGKVSGYNTYRVYARDSEGLYAYSTPITLRAYSFNTEIKVTDVNYPEKIQIDVIFSGSNVPDVRNVQLIYDVHELYSEAHNMTSLKKYVAQYEENPVSEKVYQRYTGVLNVPTEKQGNNTVYNVPTAFGYIITFGDGSLINRFPVVTNVIPSGIKPVLSLTAGEINFGSSTINILRNTVITNYIAVQEAGIVYKSSSTEYVSSPTVNSSGWVRVVGERDIPVKTTQLYDITIPAQENDKYTFYAPYIRTSNGYYYGEVGKVQNNWKGDVGGPRINSNSRAIVLNSEKVIIEVPIIDLSTGIDLGSDFCIVSALKDGNSDSTLLNKPISYFNPSIGYNASVLYLELDGLNKNSSYTLLIQLKGNSGLVTNISSCSFNTGNLLNIALTNKRLVSGSTYFDISLPAGNSYSLNSTGHSILNPSLEVGNLDLYVDSINNYIRLPNTNIENYKVLLSLKYKYNSKSIDFDREFTLY